MKKILSTTLILMLAFALLAACAPEPTAPPAAEAPAAETPAAEAPAAEAPAEEAAPAPDLDGPTTEISIWFMGGSVQDDSDVVEAANARLRELGLNITVRPIWSGGWDMGSPGQIALDTGDTSIDIIWTSSWGLLYPPNASIGNFVRLDDPNNDLLAAYGQDLLAAVPDMLWDAFTVEGPAGLGIYAIPGYKDYAQLLTWDVNNTRLEELGIDFYELFDPDGLNTDVFFDPLFEEAMVRAREMWGPTFFPLAHDGHNWAGRFSFSDSDQTGVGAFHFTFDPNNPAQPTDFLPGLVTENELYMRVQERMQHFWDQGFIDPRAAIPAEATSVFVDQRGAGEYLFTYTVYAYGHTAQASESRGIDARFPRVNNPIVSTGSATGSGFALSIYSQNHAEAIQFMNAWYTDQILADILAEGVEGTHFERNADGTITRLPGGRDIYSPWRFGMGNIFILSPLEADGPDYFTNFAAFNAEGTPTTFLGFTFDGSNVLTELAATAAVRDEFQQTLNVGATDPVAGYAQFMDAMRANGLERIQEELNRQLGEFFAAR